MRWQVAGKTGLEWHGGPQPKRSDGVVRSIGLNQGGPKLAVDPVKPVTTVERDRLADRHLQEGMGVDVQKITDAEGDTRRSGRIPL